MADEEDLSCIICSNVYTDPRVLPCGHSFCSACIAQWRQNQPVCPNCRGPIGSGNPPRNTILANIVERFLQQQQHAASLLNACDKCGRSGPAVQVCRHCRHPLCGPCTVQHVQKLKVRTNDAINRLEPLLKKQEDRMDQLLNAQAEWTHAQASLAAVLAKVNNRLDLINSEVANRTDLIHSSREQFAAMKSALTVSAASATDAALLGRTIMNVNCLALKFSTDDDQQSSSAAASNSSFSNRPELEGTSAEVDELITRLSVCVDVNNVSDTMVVSMATPEKPKQQPQQQPQPQQQQIPSTPSILGPGPPTKAILSKYYSSFPQQFTYYFTVVGSIVSLTVCSNTEGYLYGRGMVLSARTVAAAGEQASFKALPDEVILILEGVSPHTKLKAYGVDGSYKGNIDMKMPDGSGPSVSPNYNIAANDVTQLLAISLSKINQVLVTTLDGSHKLLVTNCCGLDLDNPLGTFLTDNNRVYIADFRNRRVCSVCCDTGQVVRVFKHNSLARVDRIAVAKDGTVLARVEPCHLVILKEQPEQLPARLPEIKRKFFHFQLDPFGDLVFTSGGGLQTGQLYVLRQPCVVPDSGGSSNPPEFKLIQWSDVKYSCVLRLKNGQILASAANKKEIHFF
ncbi:hypothetical protein BOX15_Mlig032067g1 [Macrostomum lignano]|uniref:RING-type domain-containing protein n=2 Tax=Macrostomum lignano TaxID=282301 RepID=A0A267GWB1_9PLAT|nr:hypothetical protein BOX15_Mlig032067g1 [Macrostomum lignano]